MKRKLLLWKATVTFTMLLLFLFDVGLSAQNSIDIRGVVLDATSKEPLIGVSVIEKGTSNGTITDIDGKFILKAKSSSSINFSYIGYASIELKAEKSMGTVLMKEDMKTLQEVVVVGYGTQKKVNLTGAVSSIDGAEIAAKPASDALTALQGEMPGVAVLRSSGKPGSETSGVRIRGFSSSNTTTALVLIDGLEGDMTLVNPNDIASISVLKDAAAAAIYGSRAAAGVILITTKSGSEGKPTISYNGYFGVNTPGNMPERLPAWEEQNFINLSRVNENGSPEWNPEMTSWVGNPNFNYRPNNSNGRWDLFQATNWVAEGTKDYTTQQSHSLSVSGGSKSLNYIVSTGYYTKNGLLKYGPDKNDRYNFRMRLNSEVNNYISLGVQVNYNGSFVNTNPYGAEGILSALYRTRGRQPIYNPEEDINLNPYNGDLQVNPIDLMKNGGISKNDYQQYTGRGEMTIKNVIKGLELKLTASRQAGYYTSEVDKRYLVWYDRLGKTIRSQANNPNSLAKTKNGDYHDTFEALLTYGLKLGKHNINALAGSTFEQYKKDEISATVTNLNSNDFFSFGYYDSSVAGNTTLGDKIDSWAMMSYIGRVNYSFDDKYLFEANVRYDGSSRVAPQYRWQAFPSFSAAWRVNQEKWFNVSFIDNLKLRASWGELGNGAVLGLYDYIPLISSGTELGNKYYWQDQLASKDKKWETISTTNIGLDLGFLSNKLNLTADYYWKYNNHMLAQLPEPSLIGIKVPSTNVGKLKTWGWEVEASYKDKVGDLSYQVSFNLSDSQSKLLEYNGQNTIKEGSVALLQNYPLNTIWGYQTDGYWSSKDEYIAYKTAHPGYQSFADSKVSGGDIKYVAQGNPDHTIGAGGGTPDKPGDLLYMGDSNGHYLYGINLSAQWKNFDLGVMFQGVGKRKVVIDTNTIAPFGQTQLMPWTIHRDYWTVDNQDAYWPRLYNYAQNNGNDVFNFHPSDRWIQDGSYIRLKNLQLGYTIPVSKNVLQKLRVYISGEDIWEHTKMLSVFDPEVGNNASANYYPFFRTWAVGVNVTF